jgi:hypothetical protein
METLRMSWRNRLKLVFSQRFCPWIHKILNTKAATLQRKTCTSRTEETMFRNKALEELQFLRRLKMLLAGL